MPQTRSPFPSILNLLFFSSPSAVGREIALIVINSVNRVFGGRARPHIGHKIRERLLPSFADSDTSSSIVGIFWYIFVSTSIEHVLPSLILGFMCIVHSMSSVSDSSYFSVETTARFPLTYTEQGRLGINYGSTITSTPIDGMLVYETQILNDSKSVKPRTEGQNYSRSSHISFSQEYSTNGPVLRYEELKKRGLL